MKIHPDTWFALKTIATLWKIGFNTYSIERGMFRKSVASVGFSTEWHGARS